MMAELEWMTSRFTFAQLAARTRMRSSTLAPVTVSPIDAPPAVISRSGPFVVIVRCAWIAVITSSRVNAPGLSLPLPMNSIVRA